VVGVMHDKDMAQMLRRMDPLVDHWHFVDLPTPRAASAASLQALWTSVTQRRDADARTHASPAEGLRAAVEATDPTGRIVVFGSFYTVGGVLENGLPKLQAPHLGT
jgi:dihydrofolate synthase/folylpolyglutamate synthase